QFLDYPRQVGWLNPDRASFPPDRQVFSATVALHGQIDTQFQALLRSVKIKSGFCWGAISRPASPESDASGQRADAFHALGLTEVRLNFFLFCNVCIDGLEGLAHP